MTSRGTIRYWAAARASAGTAEESYAASTLHEALTQASARHGAAFNRLLKACSFVVDGNPVGTRDAKAVALSEGGTVEVLPPFAGG